MTLTIFPSAVFTNSVVVGNEGGSDLLFNGETKTQLSAKSNSIHRQIFTRWRQANFIKIILRIPLSFRISIQIRYFSFKDSVFLLFFRRIRHFLIKDILAMCH